MGNQAEQTVKKEAPVQTTESGEQGTEGTASFEDNRKSTGLNFLSTKPAKEKDEEEHESIIFDDPEIPTTIPTVVGSLKKTWSTTYWYNWNAKEKKFVKGDTINKKAEIMQAFPVRKTPNVQDEMAWIKIKYPDPKETGELVMNDIEKKGYVRKKDINVGANQWQNQLKSPEYIDAHALTAPHADTQLNDPKEYQENDREWYINLAVLMDAYGSLEDKGDDEETERTRADLALAMLQSFAKTAGIESPLRDFDIINMNQQFGLKKRAEIATSAFLDEPGYYRSSSPTLYEKLEQAVTEDMGLAKENSVKVVSDPFFGEVIRRTYPLLLTKDDDEVPIETTIIDMQDFRQKINTLCDYIVSGYRPKGIFLFDLSEVYANKGGQPDKVKNVTADFEQALAEEIDGRGPACKGLLKENVLEKINLFILTVYKGINVFIQLIDSLSGEPLQEVINHYGQKVDPIKAKELLLKFKKPGEIFKSEGVPGATLATRGKGIPTVYESFKAFIESNTFKAFENLSKSNSTILIPPYQKIYPAATADLIKGLLDVPGGIDAIFKEKGINDLLQISYYRMAEAMKRAIFYANGKDMVRFLNNIEWLHDQLQMILTIVKPHARDTVFAESIIAALNEKPWEDKDKVATYSEIFWAPWEWAWNKFSKSPPKPLVHHKASSMHAAGSILSGVEKQKGTNRLNVLAQKDSYYETVGALNTDGAIQYAKTYHVSVLDGQKIDSDKPGDAFEDKKTPRDKIDIFFCEFHHNISKTSKEYHSEDVIKQVDWLFQNGMVAKKFTIAVDCTIDYIRSKHIQDLLAHFSNKITSGALNIIFYRSAQKFDMLGMDNYYGGYTIAINNAADYEKFNERISQDEDQVSGLAHQGMAHLNKYGSKHLDAYREALIENTKYLYDKLIHAGMDNPSGNVCIAKTSDPYAVYIDVTFKNVNLKSLFVNWAYYYDLNMTSRSSFGFPTFNITDVVPKTRLNPGLESREDLDKYAAFLIKLNKLSNRQVDELINGFNKNKKRFIHAFKPTSKLPHGKTIHDQDDASTLRQQNDATQEAKKITKGNDNTSNTAGKIGPGRDEILSLLPPGYKIKPNHGGGNCLFYAVRDLLHQLGIDKTHEQLRKEAVDHIRESNPENTQRIIRTGEETFYNLNSYLTYMEKDGSWGTDLEIKALCETNGVSIVVLQPNSQHYELFTPGELRDIIYPGALNGLNDVLYIYHTAGNHYEAVVRTDH